MAISFEGDEAFALAVLDEAISRRTAVRLMKNSLGIPQMIKSFDLSNGCQVYVVDLEHTQKMHIVAPAKSTIVVPEKKTFYYYVENGIPDYVSGAVTQPVIETTATGKFDDNGQPIMVDSVREVKITEQTSERISMYDAKIKLATPETGGFAAMQNPLYPIRYTQHKNIHPGFYSGWMRTVVQVLLGIGTQSQDSYERRSGLAHQLQRIDMNDTAYVARSAFGLYNPDRTRTVEVLYDYRFNKTHGITLGGTLPGKTEKLPYLIEIGQAGVIAFPLSLDPVSLTADGAARYKELYPELFSDYEGGAGSSSGIGLFDFLGGFPTGEFPYVYERDRASLIRAGEAVVICSTNAFYANSMYSSAMGWVFNESGSEAHNTCWGSDAKGVSIGYLYGINIEIGDFTPAITDPRAGQLAGELGRAQTLRVWENNKIGRLSSAQVETLLSIRDAKAKYEAFDSMEVKAEFKATGSCKMSRKGYLYHPGKLAPTGGWCNGPSGQPQIKFWEPIMESPISFDFGYYEEVSDMGWRQSKLNPAPKCDTPMLVLYGQGGEIDIVNYFYRDTPPVPFEQVDTREPCQFDGTWTSESNTLGTGLFCNFYSSQWDPRKELSIGVHTKTTSTGKFLGNTDFMDFGGFWEMCCDIRKEFWYATSYETSATGAQSANAAVVWPGGDRNIYYTVEVESTTSSSRSSGTSKPYVAGYGNVVKHGRVYHFIFHWLGSGCIKEEGGPSPGDGPPCMLREVYPSTVTESCFSGAPSFPYYSVCGGDWTGYHGAGDLIPGGITIWYSKRFGNEPPGEAHSSTTPPEATLNWRSRIFGDTSLNGSIIDSEALTQVNDSDHQLGLDIEDSAMSMWWWRASPTGCETPTYAPPLNININTFGDALTVYEPQFEFPSRYEGTPIELKDNLAGCFIGYVAK
jgi:hypothetical protein